VSEKTSRNKKEFEMVCANGNHNEVVEKNSPKRTKKVIPRIFNGSRCNVCGAPVDSGNTCNNGHKIGEPCEVPGHTI